MATGKGQAERRAMRAGVPKGSTRVAFGGEGERVMASPSILFLGTGHCREMLYKKPVKRSKLRDIS